MAVKPIPEGYHAVTPYLIVDGAAKAIDFYKRVFNASEVMRMPAPGGKVGHAEIKIGDCHLMLADEFPEMGAKGPRAYGGSPVNLMVYIKDVDNVVKLAVELGGKLVRPIEDRFYGDRSGQIEDPFGHSWTVATHVEDVPPEEMERRAKAYSEKNA